MGASRLQAADVLGVAVPFFFEGAMGGPYVPDGSAPSPSYMASSSPATMGLAKAFMHVRPALPRRIVALVSEIAGGE